MDVHRAMSFVALAAVASLLASCETSTSQSGPAPSPSAPVVSPTDLPGQCNQPAVVERMQSFLRDITTGSGEAVAAHFLGGSGLRWEVYKHFDAPNGTQGALRTRAQIAGFISEVHAGGEAWVYVRVEPPTGTAGLPDKGVYALSLAIKAGGTTRPGGAKVVIDCRTGLISRMVGPASG